MKKILTLILAAVVTESIVLAANENLISANSVGTSAATATAGKPEYIAVIKNSQTFYYDKQGRLIAHDKKVNGQTFFYDRTGQFVGKSVKRNDTTYYYNGINKFIGTCTENECFNGEFVSTGKIPPLPTIKHFTPVYDEELVTPKPKTNSSEEG